MLIYVYCCIQLNSFQILVFFFLSEFLLILFGVWLLNFEFFLFWWVGFNQLASFLQRITLLFLGFFFLWVKLC